METILEKIFVETYKLDLNIINMRQMESDLATIYKVKFVAGRFRHIMIECDFVNFEDCREGHEYFTKGKKSTVKIVDKEDALKYIDTFFLYLVKSCIEINKSYDIDAIRRYIRINNGLFIDAREVCRYAKMIYSDIELFELWMHEKEDITYEVIKNISYNLNMNQDKVVSFLTEKGYKFKISESDLKEISLTKERAKELLDNEIRNLTRDKEINYKRLVEVCNDRTDPCSWCNSGLLEETINKYSLRQKEIVEKLGGKFVGFYDQTFLKMFSSDNKIEMIPLMMIIGNMKE